MGKDSRIIGGLSLGGDLEKDREAHSSVFELVVPDALLGLVIC